MAQDNKEASPSPVKPKETSPVAQEEDLPIKEPKGFYKEIAHIILGKYKRAKARPMSGISVQDAYGPEVNKTRKYLTK